MHNYTRDQRRFWDTVRKTDTCWEWKKPGTDGYGRFYMQGGFHQAHRVAYEWEHGVKVPVHLVIDHLCRNHACVRPSHLEPVTNAENMRRAVRKPRSRVPSVEPSPTKPQHKIGSRPRYCRVCLKPSAECGPLRERICNPCRAAQTALAMGALNNLMR